MPGTPIIVSKCTKKPLFYNVEEGYITASFSLTAGVIDTNLLLLNWTKKEEIYNITADSNKYLLGVANDGSLVMEKTSKSTQLQDQFQFSESHYFAETPNNATYYLTVKDDERLGTTDQPNDQSNFENTFV